MLNSASKCLKISLKFIKFSKPEGKKCHKKLKLRGISPLSHLELPPPSGGNPHEAPCGEVSNNISL
jgi:hypothetical protein